MKFIRQEINDVVLVCPSRFNDDRGYFSEIYKSSAFQAEGLIVDFVQDNKSLSRRTGTLRGLHYQLPPFAQAKLVSVSKGSIFDVAVDIRRSSPSFGKFVAATLTAADNEQLFIPAGFAHGFCTLEDDVEVVYKVSNPYSAQHDRSILWADPAIGINWPTLSGEALLSAKDAQAPLLADVRELF